MADGLRRHGMQEGWHLLSQLGGISSTDPTDRASTCLPYGCSTPKVHREWRCGLRIEACSLTIPSQEGLWRGFHEFRNHSIASLPHIGVDSGLSRGLLSLSVSLAVDGTRLRFGKLNTGFA